MKTVVRVALELDGACVARDGAEYYFCLPSLLVMVKVNLQWVPCRVKGSDYPKGHTSPDPKFHMVIGEVQILI